MSKNRSLFVLIAFCAERRVVNSTAFAGVSTVWIDFKSLSSFIDVEELIVICILPNAFNVEWVNLERVRFLIWEWVSKTQKFHCDFSTEIGIIYERLALYNVSNSESSCWSIVLVNDIVHYDLLSIYGNFNLRTDVFGFFRTIRGNLRWVNNENSSTNVDFMFRREFNSDLGREPSPLIICVELHITSSNRPSGGRC